jgi:hypothetical protein
MKKSIAVITSILLFVCFSAVSAHADRKTFEGFMLGTGVAILGAAIINGMHTDQEPQYARHPGAYDRGRAGYRYAPNPRHAKRAWSRGPGGHWEIERIWIRPVYEKKWNPGHYNPRGEWVRGRHERFMIKDGYYHEKKVWLRHR